jgi:hypothetical protein
MKEKIVLHLIYKQNNLSNKETYNIQYTPDLQTKQPE